MLTSTANPSLAFPAADDDLLRTLLEVSLTGVILFRPVYGAGAAPDDAATIVDFAYVYLNPAAQHMLGQPEQPAETYLTLYPHAVQEGIFAFYRETFTTGVAGRIDVNYQYDGLDNFFELGARRSGQYLIVSFSDTADHNRSAAEEALRASQIRERAALADAEAQRRRLYDAVMHLPAEVVVHRGPELIFEYVNPRYQLLFADRPLLGLPLRDALPELADHYVELFTRVYQTGEPYYGLEMEAWLDFSNTGQLEQRYFNLFFQALRDAEGQINGLLNFAYDVTEQVIARRQVQALNDELTANNTELRAAQEQLQTLNLELEDRVLARTFYVRMAQRASEQSAQQLRLITDGLPVLISYIDHEERYQFTNQAYKHWFNLTSDQIMGRSVRDLVGERAYQNVKQYIDRALAGERLDFEALMPYRDDLVRHIRTNYVPDVQNGKVVGFYALVADVTSEVMARQEVQALNEELAAINEEMQVRNEELGETNQRLLRTNADLDNFVYTASHDLRAPITNLEGLLHALREELPAELRQTPPIQPLLEMMQGAVDRFQLTLSQLTDISKLQQAQHQPAETVDLATIVEDVRLDLTYMLKAGDVRLTVDVETCPTVSFSPKNLRSIIYNLLSNAVKYRALDRQPVVQLRCRSTAPYIVLEVEDNGLGLSEFQQTKLFTMFQRLHSHVEGSGVGLYMVKKIVDNAGGTIRVLSRPGVGSTFTVTLPVGAA